MYICKLNYFSPTSPKLNKCLNLNIKLNYLKVYIVQNFHYNMTPKINDH